MKKIYIAVVFLIICTGVCVFEQVTINNVYTKTSEIINTALELNERKKFEESKEECIKYGFDTDVYLYAIKKFDTEETKRLRQQRRGGQAPAANRGQCQPTGRLRPKCLNSEDPPNFV